MLGKNIQKYFWDVDISTLNTTKHKKYIIERLLDIGDENAVAWLKRKFSKRDIAKVLKSSRRISKKSLNFWKIALPNL